MKLLEVIELRAAESCRQAVEQHLESWLAQARRDLGADTFRSYRRIGLSTDYSVHLSYETPGDKKALSTLGKRLVQHLKEFGLVSHSVWAECPAPPDKA